MPTPAEWASWPEYCRVQFASVTQWRDSEFARAYHPSTIDSWRSMMGERTFSGLHHYCASLIYLMRARLERDARQRQFILSNALDDALYTYRSADPKGPYFVEVALGVAHVRRAMGALDEAQAVLERLLRDHADRPEPYSLLALIHRQQGRLQQAREILIQGDAATNRSSAELSYTLGLICLEMGDVDAAVAYAERAYQIGYPLPALRDRLARMGRWKR